MRIKKLGIFGLPVVLVLAAVVPLSAAAGGAGHVSWDIVSVSPLPVPTAPVTFNPGGVATAQTPEGATITLTGLKVTGAVGTGSGDTLEAAPTRSRSWSPGNSPVPSPSSLGALRSSTTPVIQRNEQMALPF